MSQVEAILVGASALLFSALRIYRVFDSEMVKESKLEDLKTIGIILGTAIGDAKGIPYETLTYAQCLELKPHALKSVFEKCAAENRYCPNYGPGKWTDDTQLTLAMMRTLTRRRGLDWDDLVREHIAEWQRSTIGWGGTQYAVHRLSTGIHSIHQSGNKTATGNGVLMKLVPLIYFYSRQLEDSECYCAKESDLITLTKMTHGSPVAIVTALVMSEWVECLFRGKLSLDSPEARRRALECAIELAEHFESQHIKIDERVSIPDDTKDPNLQSYFSCNLRVSYYLKQLLANWDEVLLSDEPLSKLTNGGTYHCASSLSMVIGILVTTNEFTFESTVLRAALIGGDTDSNAALVGGILGGLHGTRWIPSNYVAELHESEMLIETAKNFNDIFL